MGLLPDAEGLEALIRYLNISPDHHVVAYDDEGGAGRASALEPALFGL